MSLSFPVCDNVKAQVPLTVSSSFTSCDNVKVRSQNTSISTFCDSHFHVITPASVPSVSVSDHVMLHELVHASGFPNYALCRFPICPVPCKHSLLAMVLEKLSGQICDFLEDSWPVGYDYSSQSIMPPRRVIISRSFR